MANLEVEMMLSEAAITGTCRMVQGPDKKDFFGQCDAGAILEFEDSIGVT